MQSCFLDEKQARDFVLQHFRPGRNSLVLFATLGHKFLDPLANGLVRLVNEHARLFERRRLEPLAHLGRLDPLCRAVGPFLVWPEDGNQIGNVSRFG